MKKLLLTLIVSIAFCGTIIAQHETHWPEFNLYQYENNDGIVAFVKLNGEFIERTDNWADYEVGAFVGGVIRGHAFLVDYFEEYGDPHPLIELSVYYDATGEAVTFTLYDHSTGTEYTDCTSNIEIITGEDHLEEYDDPETAVVLSFVGSAPTPPTPSTFTKEITGYGEGNNYWYFIASPVEEPVVPSAENGFLTDAFDFFYFDQAFDSAEWRGYDVENFVVENGKGYLYASQENTTLTFTGTPFMGEEGDGYAEVELIYAENHAWSGWNLVGNPFADDAYVYDDHSFYRLDPESGNYLPYTNEELIPMMEGIFVETLEQTDEVIAFVTAGTGDAGGGNIGKLVINVNQGRGVSDRAIVRFDGKSTLSKLQFKSNSTQVYIPVDGKDYAVANAPEMGEMPVSFKAGNNGTYTMSFSNKNVEFNYLHLIDNMTGADVDLLVNPSYTFDASTTDYASRFKLVFATGNNSDDNFAFFSNGSFIISNEGNAVLQVVDVTGRILNNETINGSANVYVNAAPGVYMLRLINGDNVKVQKVVVK